MPKSAHRRFVVVVSTLGLFVLLIFGKMTFGENAQFNPEAAKAIVAEFFDAAGKDDIDKVVKLLGNAPQNKWYSQEKFREASIRAAAVIKALPDLRFEGNVLIPSYSYNSARNYPKNVLRTK